MASFTITNVIPSFQDAQFKTAYRKAFSDASNIWQQMRANNEIEPCTGNYDSNCASKNYVTFKSYMKAIKSCEESLIVGPVTGCWDINGEGFYEKISIASSVPNKTTGNGAVAFIDSSGRGWLMVRGSFTEGDQLIVDTNGFKQPNKFGKDKFAFWLNNPDNLTNGIGIYTKLAPAPDRTEISMDCGYPPCYGTSWLLGK